MKWYNWAKRKNPAHSRLGGPLKHVLPHVIQGQKVACVLWFNKTSFKDKVIKAKPWHNKYHYEEVYGYLGKLVHKTNFWGKCKQNLCRYLELVRVILLEKKFYYETGLWINHSGCNLDTIKRMQKEMKWCKELFSKNKTSHWLINRNRTFFKQPAPKLCCPNPFAPKARFPYSLSELPVVTRTHLYYPKGTTFSLIKSWTISIKKLTKRPPYSFICKDHFVTVKPSQPWKY